jgi:ferrous iron transport protein B
MREDYVHFYSKEPLIALVGNPNCGKTALFNRITGGRQHVANYAGVTVERVEGSFTTKEGKKIRIIDLPGIYSLYPRSNDERLTCDVLAGRAKGEKKPDLVVCVLDATNLRRSLRIALAVKRTGLPCVIALNMMDEAQKLGVSIDLDQLSKLLDLPVVSTVAVKRGGERLLLDILDSPQVWQQAQSLPAKELNEIEQIEGDHLIVQKIIEELHLEHVQVQTWNDKIDRYILHPVFGPLLLILILFTIFQAMFSWAAIPVDAIHQLTEMLKNLVLEALSEGWFRSLLVDGILAGVMGVVAFLPQILLLYFFIMLLEEIGYLPRAAYLLDRLMGGIGLSGRSFIPLLSCFACAVPGVFATRSIPNERDRKVTMLLAPLMTCSARLPIYSLLIAAFIPRVLVFGFFELQGLVMLGLYFLGILGAVFVALCLKYLTTSGKQIRPLMMELPRYRWPSAFNIVLGLWQRAWIFFERVGGIILIATIIIWFLASFPQHGGGEVSIENSFAGIIGSWLTPLLSPIGFNWQISIALIPGMMAREVAISALGTVYSLSAVGVDEIAGELAPLLAREWSLATGLSLLTWFVFAPQCISTLAAIKNESGGFKLPLIVIAYLFVLAYVACWIVYNTAVYFGL